MELIEFIRQVRGFDGLTHPEKIKRFAWYLHTHRGLERVEPPAVRACYQTLHLPCPDLGRDLQRLTERKPAELMKDRRGYFLAGPVRRQLDQQYGEHETVITVSQLLKELPGKVSDEAERRFLSEALICYKHQAFRAAIIMTWNLAYDHLLRWIVADAHRLAGFNAAITKRYPNDKKKAGLAIAHRDDFEELKEFEVVEICGTAGLFSANLKKILKDKLDKRNMAAHPSLVEIGRAQADDAITDLVNNVVLKLV
jgi:hypothetical protein